MRLRQMVKGSVCKRLVLGAVGLIAAVVISGCGTAQMGWTFHEDGSITFNTKVEVTQQARNFDSSYQQQLDEMKQDARNSGVDVTPTNNGFKGTKEFSSIQALIDSQNKVWNSEEFEGVLYRKGFLYDTYSVRIGIPKNGSVPDFSYNANNPFEMMASQMMQSLIESAKADISITVPYAVDSTNADSQSPDGKTLTWDIKPAFLQNEDVKIQADFRIYHRNTLIALAVVGAMLLILAIGLVVFTLVNKNNLSRNVWFVRLAVLLVLVVVGSGIAVKMNLDHPPTLTSADKVEMKSDDAEKDNAKSNDTADSQKSKDTATKGADKAAETPNQTAAREAEKVFTDYHKAITDKRYHDAYQLMTPQLQQSIGSEQDYTAGYTNTVSSTVSNVKILSADPNSVKLSYDLKARDHEGSGIKVQTFQGTATLINKGKWRIDEIAATKTGESME